MGAQTNKEMYELSMKPEPLYHGGYEVRMTGKSEVLHGGLFHEALIVSNGHRKGDRVWIRDAAEVKADTLRRQAEWTEQQAAWRKLREASK